MASKKSGKSDREKNPSRRRNETKALPKSSTKPSTKKTVTIAKIDERTKTVLRNILIWVIVFFASLIVVDYAVQYLNYKASVAIVNGERIYRKDFNQKLEQSYGKDMITQMINEALIYQKGTEKNITISSSQVDEKIKEFEEQFGGQEGLEQQLLFSGITMEELRKRVETSLIVEEILADKIVVTEEEIQEYYDENKESIIPGNTEPTYEEAKTTIESILKDQKLNLEVGTWLTEVTDSSNIKNNIENPKDYSFLGITRTFIKELFSKVSQNNESD